MTCDEVDKRLPAYLEDLLSPEEKKNIEGHMADCIRCSRTFADMKKVEALVHNLSEVEPPPFFEQRIMSRIREEAGQQSGFLRRIFYPLHIKVPIQALATILIAVLGFYVYERGGPEMQQRAPLPLPLTILEKGKDTAASPQAPTAPAALSQAKQPPPVDFPDVNRQRFAAPPFEMGGKADKTEERPMPVVESHPSAMKSAAPVRMGTAGKSQDRAEEQQTLRGTDPLPPERKHKEISADSGAAAEASRKLMAAAAINGSAIDLAIQVSDVSAAGGEIEALLGKANARIIEKGRREGGELLKAEMAIQNVDAFLDRMEAIGRVKLGENPVASKGGKVTVIIMIVGNP